MKSPAALLFIASGVFFTLFHPGHPMTVDSATTLQTVRALARGELHIPEMMVTREGREGRHYSLYGPLLPALSLPGYLVGARFDDPPPPPGSPDVGWGDWAALNVNAWVSAGVLVFLFLLGTHFGMSDKSAFLAAAACGSSTMLLPYARDFFSQPLSALLLTGAAYGFLQFQKDPRLVRLLGAAVAVALLPWARMDMGLGFGVLILWILMRPPGESGTDPNRTRDLRVAAAPLAVSVVCLLLFDRYRWGRWGGAPYGDQRFDTPLIDTIPRFFFGSDLSVFLYNPLLVPSILFLILHWKQLKWFATPVLLFDLTYLLLVGKYGDYHGGVCPGPRYLLSLVPLNLIPLFFGLAHATPRIRSLMGGVLLLSFAVGILVNGYEAVVDYTTAPTAWDYWTSLLFESSPR